MTESPVCTTQVTIPPFSTLNVQTKSQCQRTLHVGPRTHRTSTRSPVACSSGTDSHLWRVASWVLKGTHLIVQLEHPYCGNSCKSCGWTGCPCQPNTTGNPPNQDFQRVKSQITKRMGPGGLGPSRCQRVARVRAETCQRATAQIGASI